LNIFGEGGKAVLMTVILLLLARSVTKEEYGIFTLAQVLALMLIPIGGLGLSRTISRHIGYYQALGDRKMVNSVIRSSIHIWPISAVAISLLFFALSVPLGHYVFRHEDYLPNFQMFSIYVGANIVSQQVGGIFRGLREVKPKIYFVDLMPRVLALGIFAVLAYQGAPILMYSTAYAMCFTASAVMSIFYLLRHYSLSGAWIPTHMALLAFSLPVLVQEIFFTSNSKLSVLILGIFVDPATVASYTVAQKIAARIPFINQGMLFIFLPILSGYMARKDTEAMRKIYARFTKWVILLALPGILLLLLFPVQVLALFGDKYRSSWSILILLTIAHSWSTFLGPAGPTIIAMGRVRMLMLFALLTAAVNVSLNVALIPAYGGLGSAIATVTALGIYAFLTLGYVYRRARIHPFNRDYVRLLVHSPGLCFLEHLLIVQYMGTSILSLAVAVPAFMATVWGLALLLGLITGSERRAVMRRLHGMFGGR